MLPSLPGLTRQSISLVKDLLSKKMDGGIKSGHDDREVSGMIDHVSVCVRDLEQAARFYQAVLEPIGYQKLRVGPHSAGFGRTYPEFWINLRPVIKPLEDGSGAHVALRAPA